MDSADSENGLGPESHAEHFPLVNRRGFIGGATVLAGAAALDAITHSPLVGQKVDGLFDPNLLQIQAGIKPGFSIDVRRREDFLFLRVDGYNLRRHGQRLVRRNRYRSARLVITFVPQHLAEEAFFRGRSITSPGFAKSYLAAPSRLAFIVPPSGIPLTIGGLLDWTNFTPSLVPAARFTSESTFRGRVKRRMKRPGRLSRSPAARRRAVSSAVSDRGPFLREPRADETAIELPWHLALSPTRSGRWSHETEPITLHGATELWRTRLITPSEHRSGGAIRAVWNFDTQTPFYVGPGTPTLDGGEPRAYDRGPFRTSLSPNDRWQIVRASSDFRIQGRADISARELALSARGGSLDSEGHWESPELSLAEWAHQATQGRDQFVKVVNKGFLFPFGVRVAKIKVTEREFDPVNGNSVAALRQRIYLVVRDPIVRYSPGLNPTVADGGRDFLFRALKVVTTRTPQLDEPSSFVASLQVFNDTPFVPTVEGEPFAWHFVGTDWSGRPVGFAAPAVFVSAEDAFADIPSGAVRDAYNSTPSGDPVRTTNFNGAKITFAESMTPGDTEHPAYQTTFAASPGIYLGPGRYQDHDLPHCTPTLVATINGRSTGAQVSVRLASAEQAAGNTPLTGASDGYAPSRRRSASVSSGRANDGNRASSRALRGDVVDGHPLPTIAYYPDFVQAGFSTAKAQTANAGNVYMQMVSDATRPAVPDAEKATNLVFNRGSTGGLLTPNLQVQGLSRSLGPVGDLDSVFRGKFDPKSIFAGLQDDLQAKILGGVPLKELLAPVTNILAGATPDTPNVKTLKISSKRDKNTVTTTVTWSPDIVLDNPVITKRGADKPTKFTLVATITTDVQHPASSQYSIVSELDNFVVNLLSKDTAFITITFDKVSFTSASGKKPDVKPVLAGVDFVGPLSFVKQLQSLMSFSGGGLKIEELGNALNAEVAVKLPSISVGVLSISHLSLDSGFNLPFDGTAALFNFDFATRSNPFQLAVGIFGGGGFFGIGIGTGGVRRIEASLDFGAMAALDLGVASGSAQIVAGIYFKYGTDPNTHVDTCLLTGYVRVTGNLNVLGIITLSLEFDLSLTYSEPPSEVTGTATLVVSVSLLYFHQSVTLTASKTFVNSGGSSKPLAKGPRRQLSAAAPQTFGDQVSQSDWNAYCRAFGPSVNNT